MMSPDKKSTESEAAAREGAARKAAILTFTVPFEGKPDKPIEMAIYAFSREGELLATAPVRDGKAKLSLPDAEVKFVRLMIAPPRPQSPGEKTLTPDELDRMRAYQPIWTFNPRQREYELLPIPEFNWKWWFWCSCRVRGRVVRPVQIEGVLHDMPVCNARVHVCEVDRLWWLIPRLPDPIIKRIRDELLQIEWPPRPIPIPDPPPFEFDPGVIDPSPINLARMNLMSQGGIANPLERVGFNPQPDPPGEVRLSSALERVALNPQPLPPKQSTALQARSLSITASVAANAQVMALSGETQTALQSTSIPIVRQALIDNLALIRPFICIWDWLWPYFCFCDEIAVVTTDHTGRFDTTIWYQCFGDHPDLYFWVEYCIGGVWTTVYHPGVCCNTYWNYVCGSDVTLRVTDPRVPWCGDDPILPGKQVAILSIGRNDSMTQIQRQAAGVNEGLTTAGQPFGGSLEPHVWFGTGLLAAGITHYRWSYRRLGSSGSWHALDSEVVRHYGEIMADSTLTFRPFQLGPDPDYAGENVFKIRPNDPPLNPGAVSSSWAAEIDPRSNSASAYFLSHLLSGGDAIAGAGKYELKLELIRIVAGAPQVVNLTDEGVLLKVPTVDAPFGLGTVPTRRVPVDAAYPFDPMEERVIRDGANKVVAFRVVLHVDNNPCQADIYEVWVDNAANLAGPCGFISYANKATSQAHISFKAYHRNQFATFDFTIVKGSTGEVAAASAHGPVGVPVNGFANNPATGVFTQDVPVATLLDANGHVCIKAAFGETLHVDALATDGWSTLEYLDAGAMPMAFALEPAS
jgi:hypothetical protein